MCARIIYIILCYKREREYIIRPSPPVFSLQPEGWLFDYYKLLFVSISIAKQTAEPNCRRAPYFQVCAKEEEDGGGGGGRRKVKAKRNGRVSNRVNDRVFNEKVELRGGREKKVTQ